MATCVSIDKYHIELEVGSLRIRPQIVKNDAKLGAILERLSYRKSIPKLISWDSKIYSKTKYSGQYCAHFYHHFQGFEKTQKKWFPSWTLGSTSSRHWRNREDPVGTVLAPRGTGSPRDHPGTPQIRQKSVGNWWVINNTNSQSSSISAGP